MVKQYKKLMLKSKRWVYGCSLKNFSFATCLKNFYNKMGKRATIDWPKHSVEKWTLGMWKGTSQNTAKHKRSVQVFILTTSEQRNNSIFHLLARVKWMERYRRNKWSHTFIGVQKYNSETISQPKGLNVFFSPSNLF